MLAVKGDFFLGEYLSAIKHSLEINGIKEDSSSLTSSGFNVNNNLYEGLKDFDLSFLSGSAILIPQSDIKDLGKRHDHIIRLLHPFYSDDFEFCDGTPQSRLDALFKIKDRWTKGELDHYIAPFIDIGANFDQYLIKNTRVIKEKNPFDSSREVLVYMRKF
jgi:hypothetical protein